MRERLKLLRKALGLNQSEFALKIHVAQTTYSQFESGARTIKDIHIAQICTAFNVNENWLRTGQGEMFLSHGQDVAALAQRLSFPEICARLLYTFDSLPADQQEAVLAYTRAFIAGLAKADAAAVAEAISNPFQEDAPRQALAQRVAQESSPASAPGSDETA